MRFVGSSPYPVRWRKFARTASLLIAVIVLEGVGSLAWLLAFPSEPGSRIFLSYSMERWGLILFATFLISIFVFLLWVTSCRQERALKALKYFQDEKPAQALLVYSTLGIAALSGLHIGLASFPVTRVYYRQLLPLLVFVTLAGVQAWIFLLVALTPTRTRILNAWFPAYEKDQSYLGTIPKPLLAGLVAISILYLLAQVQAGIAVPGTHVGDTPSYLKGVMIPLSDPAFFSERRPWAILLLYKLLGGSLTAIGIAQLAFSTFAWLLLAWTLVGSLKSSAGKLLGFLVIVGISLSPAVQVWNFAAISESFSISFLIVILALFLRLLQRWKLSVFLFLLFSLLVWLSIHEVNLYIGLLAITLLLLIGLTRKQYRTFLILSFFIGAVLVINWHLSSFYALPRWALPLAEVITARVLPEPEYRDYFEKQGMPVTPELMSLSGRRANEDNFAVVNNPRLRPFSRWLFRDGKTAYAKFLIAHPVYTLTMPLVNIDEMLAADFSHFIPGYRPALPALFNELFFPSRWFWVFLVLSILLFLLVLWYQRREQPRAFWFVVVFFLLSIPSLYLAWHGDALALARHAVLANIQYHLGFWSLVVFSVDKL